MKTKWDALIKKYDVAYQEELKALLWSVTEIEKAYEINRSWRSKKLIVGVSCLIASIFRPATWLLMVNFDRA